MIKSYKVIATQIERGYVVTSKKWVALYFHLYHPSFYGGYYKVRHEALSTVLKAI
jgi:hypothetical protein